MVRRNVRTVGQMTEGKAMFRVFFAAAVVAIIVSGCAASPHAPRASGSRQQSAASQNGALIPPWERSSRVAQKPAYAQFYSVVSSKVILQMRLKSARACHWFISYIKQHENNSQDVELGCSSKSDKNELPVHAMIQSVLSNTSYGIDAISMPVCRIFVKNFDKGMRQGAKKNGVALSADPLVRPCTTDSTKAGH